MARNRAGDRSPAVWYTILQVALSLSLRTLSCFNQPSWITRPPKKQCGSRHEATKIFSEVVQKAREILELEGYDPHGSELDLVLHALVSGVEIGLMDSVMAQKVMGFSVGHERVRPS